MSNFNNRDRRNRYDPYARGGPVRRVDDQVQAALYGQAPPPRQQEDVLMSRQTYDELLSRASHATPPAPASMAAGGNILSGVGPVALVQPQPAAGGGWFNSLFGVGSPGAQAQPAALAVAPSSQAVGQPQPAALAVAPSSQAVGQAPVDWDAEVDRVLKTAPPLFVKTVEKIAEKKFEEQVNNPKIQQQFTNTIQKTAEGIIMAALPAVTNGVTQAASQNLKAYVDQVVQQQLTAAGIFPAGGPGPAAGGVGAAAGVPGPAAGGAGAAAGVPGPAAGAAGAAAGVPGPAAGVPGAAVGGPGPAAGVPGPAAGGAGAGPVAGGGGGFAFGAPPIPPAAGGAAPAPGGGAGAGGAGGAAGAAPHATPGAIAAARANGIPDHLAFELMGPTGSVLRGAALTAKVAQVKTTYGIP